MAGPLLWAGQGCSSEEAPARLGRGDLPAPRPLTICSQHLVSSKGCQSVGPTPPARAPTRILCWKEMLAKGSNEKDCCDSVATTGTVLCGEVGRGKEHGHLTDTYTMPVPRRGKSGQGLPAPPTGRHDGKGEQRWKTGGVRRNR